MIPLIVLVGAILLARAIGHFWVRALDSWAAATRVGLAVMFWFTATAHFNFMREDLVRMVPPWVPYPEFMVTFTGVAEIAGGIGLLNPATRVPSAIGLILLLLAVLPANMHAAMAGVPFGGQSPAPLVPRILLQLLFIALVWWSGLARANKNGST
ncbi:MAG: DoxX family protein [Candidatus Binatia bacterium]